MMDPYRAELVGLLLALQILKEAYEKFQINW